MELSEAGLAVKKQAVLLPIAYFPPIGYFKIMLQHGEVFFDLYEHFHKQFYYNRCLIASPNGVLKLTVPIIHKGIRMALKDVRISYEHNWRIIHWRSLEAAYRRSPYFEFYEHYFVSVFSDFKPEFLVEWNLKILEIINMILNNKTKISFTGEYLEHYENLNDKRTLGSPAELSIQSKKMPHYHQVFEERQGFIENLSIIDLLFCEGNNAAQYLK